MALTNFTERFISYGNLSSFWSHAKTYIADVMLKDYAKSADVTSAITTAKSDLTALINGVDGKLANYALSTKVAEDIAAAEARVKVTTDAISKNLTDNYYTASVIDGKVTSINSEISRVEGLFDGYYGKGEIDGKVSTINTEIGKKLATEDFNSTIANYSTTAQVEGLIASAQADDKVAWEKADSDLKDYLEGQIAAVAHLKLEKVDALPTEGQKSDVIYLVADPTSATGAFVEYIWVDSEWERIGTTTADFSNYYTKGDIDTKVTNINSAIEAAAGKGDKGIADAATALAAAQEGQRLANVAQGEVDALEGVVAELTATVGSNKTAAENAVAAVEAKIGEVKIGEGEAEQAVTVAAAIDHLEAAVKNAVAGGVNSVLLKNTDLGKALEASGAGAVELDIKTLVEGYATDGDLTSAVATINSEIGRVEGLVTAHGTAVDTWAASIQFAEDSQIQALFA